MKKTIIKALRVISAVTAAAAASVPLVQTACCGESDAPPQTGAYAYCLYCANNGEVIAAKNDAQRLPMASTTKIMTALLGLEAADIEDAAVTVTPEMYAEGSSMYLEAGQQVRLSDLVGGMLMVSGNDAANAVAQTVGGSIEGFAGMMNSRAAEMGLSDTHFVTPSGLDADGHYTTARDLAVLMAACMENERFSEIDGSKSITVDFISPEGKQQTYYNENKLLSRYDDCIAGKTGYTDKAGRTLVTCAERGGIRLVCATLNDPDDWKDHEAMFDYGFGLLSMTLPEEIETALSLPVVGGSSETEKLIAGEPPKVCEGLQSEVTTVYELPPFLYAPVKKGEKLGELKYYTGGVYAGKADITAAYDIGVSDKTTTFTENIVSFFYKYCGIYNS